MNFKKLINNIKTFLKPVNMNITIQGGNLYLDGKKIVKYFHNNEEIDIKFANNVNQSNNSLIIDGTQIHKVLFEDGTTHVFDKVFKNGNVVIQGVSNSNITIGGKKY